MKYKGSCHCGKVAFEVEGEIDSALSCNCSICSRKGSLLWFVPRSNLTLLTPEDAASTQTFNKHVIKHQFCPTCGIHPFGEGVDPGGNRMAAVNLRCLEGIDLPAIPVHEFDGRAIQAAMSDSITLLAVETQERVELARRMPPRAGWGRDALRELVQAAKNLR